MSLKYRQLIEGQGEFCWKKLNEIWQECDKINDAKQKKFTNIQEKLKNVREAW